MSLSYRFTPYLLPMLASAAFTAALLVYAWRRRSVPGATPFGVFLICMTLWSIGAALEQAAVDLPTKIFWVEFQAVWPAPAITAQLWFALEYANLNQWLTRRTLGLLAIPPLLVLALTLTNDVHHLMWLGFLFDGQVLPVLGWGNWLLTGYGYLLGLGYVLVFAWLFVQSPLHRVSAALFLFGSLIAMVVFMLDRMNFNPVAPMDPLVLVQTFVSALYALALFRFRLFDVLPVARETVIDQMHEGMVILDSQRHVVDLNPAAEKILDVPASHARGRPISQFLPLNPDAGAHLDDPQPSQTEITRATAGAPRMYSMHLSQIQDRRGFTLGHLILLHDLTVQKQAQAQLVEQQRVLATLAERERLARELHDTLVQGTAAIRMQAETTDQLLTRGETDSVHTNLERIAAAAQEMHLDLREYLFGMPSPLAEEKGFFVALSTYLAQFDQRWSTQTRLSVPAELEQPGLGAAVEAQLLRIIQEALANVRKHAAARHVEILFERNATSVQLTIRDDGCGFDLAQLAAPDARGFGTRSMRERAQAIGGKFEIRSAPGNGTCIVVQIPGEK